jgi:hypothetical protein
MIPVEAELNRHRQGAQYMEHALGELEVHLLKTETDDALAHRVRNILRNYLRLTNVPSYQTLFVNDRSLGIVVLDPDQ